LIILKKKFGILFEKKLELSEPSELTMDYLIQELHPEYIQAGAATTTARASFAKPKAPSSRGPRRLVKSGETPDDV